MVARRLQRREKWEIVSRPVGTPEVLTHTLKALICFGRIAAMNGRSSTRAA